MYGTRTDLPLPEPDELEELSRLLLEAIFRPPLPAQRVGRKGQKQYGIDVVLQAQDGRWIGAQCKRYLTARLSVEALFEEVRDAHEIEPHLEALILITTQPSDAKLLFAANQATLHGKTNVRIWFELELREYLEQYGYGHHLLHFAPEKDLLAAYEYKSGRSLSMAMGLGNFAPLDAKLQSPVSKEIYTLLDAGRPHQAIIVLESASAAELDEQERLLLRAKALYAMGDHAACTALADVTTQPSPALLAVAGLAAAQHGNGREAAKLMARAHALADGDEKAYVTGLGVLVTATVDASLSYEELIDRVPEPMRSNPELAHFLGDVAMSRERYREAMTWFEQAMEQAGARSRMHELSFATANIALALEQLPLGWSELRAPEGRALAERGRAQLEVLRLSTPPFDSVPARQAVLSNLAIACSLLGDREQAQIRAREAVDVAPNDTEMWQRWLILLLRHGAPDNIATAVADAPANPEVQLLIGTLAMSTNRPEDARRTFEAVLTSPEAAPRSHERARFALRRLDHPDELPDEVLLQSLGELELAPFAAGQFLIEHLHDTSLQEQAQGIASRVATAAIQLPANEGVAIAAMLRDQGHALAAAPLLAMLRNATRRNARVDVSVADVLNDVLLANRRFVEADALSATTLAEQPEDLRALANRTSVLIARGHLDEAWQLQASAISAGMSRISIGLIEHFAHLSRALGRVRAARHVVATHPLPETRTPAGFRGLLSALTMLRDPRVSDVLLVGTQGVLIDEATSGSVFALAIQQRPPAPRIAANTAVALRDLHSGDERLLWLGARGSGTQEAAPVAFDESWLTPLRGRTIGELVTFDHGPFAGRTFTVQSIRHPQHLLIKQAEAIAVVTGLQRGGVETISEADATLAIARMREQLKAHRDYTQQRLGRTQSLGLPTAAAAKLFRASPREFLQRSPGWAPLSGPGTADAVAMDDAAISAGGRLVLDPTTLLLLVTLDAGALARALPSPFVITPQTVAMLRQWYLLERPSVRARGSASVDADGRLQFHEYRTRDRRMQWLFWRQVRQLIFESCEIVEPRDDETASRGASMEIGFDTATLSTIALAAERGWTLVAEEIGTRNLAQALGTQRTTTLQRLIANVGTNGKVKRSEAVRWLAGLIELGWSFVVLPFWSFGAAAQLPMQQRRPTLKHLFSILRTADPYHAAPAILRFLIAQEKLRAEHHAALVSPRWLRRVVLRGLPRGTPIYRAALQKLLAEPAPGRPYRTLRRALAHWATKE